MKTGTKPDFVSQSGRQAGSGRPGPVGQAVSDFQVQFLHKLSSRTWLDLAGSDTKNWSLISYEITLTEKSLEKSFDTTFSLALTLGIAL